MLYNILQETPKTWKTDLDLFSFWNPFDFYD